MKKITCSVLFLLFTFFSITAYSDENEVRIGYLPIISSLPIYIAQENKLFEKAGIKVTYKILQSSNDIVNALIAGEIDVSPELSIVPVLHLEEKFPNNIRIFSHSKITKDKPFDKLIVREDSGIGKLSDLQGKKIGVFPGTTALNMLKEFLRKNNVDINKITFVQLAPPVQLQSLESKAIDALLSYEPTTTIALLQKKYKVLYSSVFTELLNPTPLGVAIISRNFEKEYPELAKKVINVIDNSVAYMNNNEKDSRKLLIKYNKLLPEASEKTVLLNMTLSSDVNYKNIQELVNIFVITGELKNTLESKKSLEPTNLSE